MIKEIAAISSTPKDLKSFAMVMTVGFTVVAGIMFWRGSHHWEWTVGISAFFLSMRFAWPAGLLPLQKLWMGFGIVMGIVVSHVVLTILYFVGFTVTGLAGRCLRKQFLDLRIDRNRASYWVAREWKPFDPGAAEKQF